VSVIRTSDNTVTATISAPVPGPHPESGGGIAIARAPAVQLVGDVEVAGVRRSEGLICENFPLDLASRVGPVEFVSGSMVLDYLRWGEDLNMWIPNGQQTVRTLGPTAWARLLDDRFSVYPATPTAVAYRVTINASVARAGEDRVFGSLRHSFLCAGPDFIAR
jgi:hypothetical protein